MIRRYTFDAQSYFSDPFLSALIRCTSMSRSVPYIILLSYFSSSLLNNSSKSTSVCTHLKNKQASQAGKERFNLAFVEVVYYLLVVNFA